VPRAPNLAPGSQASFEITIPNVKQIKSGVRTEVAFSGERYGYLN